MESFDFSDYLHLPPDVRARMIQLARQFRKQPTPSEAILWQAVRGRKLDGVRFRRQPPIGPFIVDFAAMKERLVVEIDGGVHETQVEADRERQQLIESVGFRFVRLKSELVEHQLPSALAVIRQALGRPGVPPSPPGPLSHAPLRGGGEGEKALRTQPPSATPIAYPRTASSTPSPPPSGARRVGEGAGG
jgi:very-short-patch-repair endonuclease